MANKKTSRKKDFTPFFYRSLLDRLKQTRDFMPRILLVGGPGLGKTTVLNAFRSEIEHDDSIVVDDLDRHLEKYLEEFPSSLKAGSDQAVLASAREPRSLLAAGDEGAGLLRSFEVISLDPRAGSVHPEEVMEQVHERFLEERLGGESPVEAEAVEVWRQAIAAISEGHPSLLGAGSDLLLRLWAFFPDSVDAQERELLERIPLQEEVEEYLEHALENVAASVIGPVLEGLERRGEPRIIEQLKVLASGEEWEGEASDRRLLLATGLVSSLKGGRLRPTCRLFRNAIQGHRLTRDEYATRRASYLEKSSVRREVACGFEDTGFDEGFLCLHGEPDFLHKVHLSGGAWRLIRRLAKEQGGLCLSMCCKSIWTCPRRRRCGRPFSG